MQPVDGGEGPIISVNSWGYSNRPGMGGPVLSGTSRASCVFSLAKSQTATSTVLNDRGVTSGC